jgi:DNA integrity scanning protein DisA with diadenylate cyclase activity
LSWVTDLWQILETVATLTKDVERANTDIKDLRRDVNTLTLTVAELKSDLKNEKETTKLILDNYESEIGHAKESIAAKFDVLTSRLDLKVADFDRRLPNPSSEAKDRRALKSGPDE